MVRVFIPALRISKKYQTYPLKHANQSIKTRYF